jgi:hypothetical protein
MIRQWRNKVKLQQQVSDFEAVADNSFNIQLDGES